MNYIFAKISFVFIITLLFLFTLLIPNSFSLDDEDEYGLGIRYGHSFYLEPHENDSVELFLLKFLPWTIFKNNNWKTKPFISLSAGGIKQGDDYAFLGTISANLAINTPIEKLTLDGGGGLAYLSQDKVGSHNFGGPLQLNFNLGVTLNKIFKNINLGYRFFHISDAGIHDGHGMNRNLIELTYMFK
ncbi:MAG: hypothetical protein GTN59_11070 [Candidatus Dadabacteria bacterium]|nr:hypothetical protein [Candidatus Dadabacteria bacterium]